MKTDFSNRQTSGNVLLITIVITGLIGFLLVAYLTLVQNQNTAIVRSQAWNAAIPVIEAGVEDALAHLNLHGLTNLLCDGWTGNGNGCSIPRRWLGENFYSVSITNWIAGASNNAPIIESRGYVAMPLILASAKGPLLANAVTLPSSASNYLGRGVRVQTAQDFIFTKGMVAKDGIDLNGNSIRTDSFDSSDPLYSINGRYDPNRFKANGDVACNASITNAVNVGNAEIYGHVSTGPNGTVAIGPNGSVGDLIWHTNGHAGIQAGYSKNDMNVSFPEVQPPFNGGYLTPNAGWITNVLAIVSSNGSTAASIPYPAGTPSYVVTNLAVSDSYPTGSPGPVTTNWNGNSGNIKQYSYPVFTATYSSYTTNQVTNVVYYNYILDQNANYQLNDLNGTVYVNAKAVLYVLASLNMSGLTIRPEKSLKLYSSASSVALSGNSNANSDGTAASFSFWGLPSCTDLSFSGNAAFTGTIYAPNATFKLNGGGNDPIDFIGASITRTATMNGHFKFHYDEALGKQGPSRGFVVTSWNEMSPKEVPIICAD